MRMRVVKSHIFGSHYRRVYRAQLSREQERRKSREGGGGQEVGQKTARKKGRGENQVK